MKKYFLLIFLLVSLCGMAEIPPLLLCGDGTRVTTKEQWENKRRPELLALFRSQIYGCNPVERPASLRFEKEFPDKRMMNGKALRKQIKITYAGPGGTGTIHLTVFLPIARKPAPGFLLICNRDKKNIAPERREKSSFWPAESIVERGYAALTFYNGDVAVDKYNGFTNGVYAVFQPDPDARTKESWGAIGAWAWGASRVMDWIETEPMLDAKRIAVVGHSRGGKTALWCGVQDRRFAMTCSNDSGCTGAKLNRGSSPESESIARITKTFPYWFCRNYDRYAGREDDLPVDQHQLLALIAPRILCVGSASADIWAGPESEFQSCLLASPAWTLYGFSGMEKQPFPRPGQSVHTGRIQYHLREGKHNLQEFDWDQYLNAADRHWGAPEK